MSISLPESVFRSKVNEALEQVRCILDTHKNAVYASDTPHSYHDKYLLTEFLTNAALASHLTSLSNCGLNAAQLMIMMDWAKTRAVSLQFRVTEKCTFIKKVSKNVDSEKMHVVESSMLGSFTSKVVTTITEYLWKFEYDYELLVYRGTGESDDDKIHLQRRSASHQLITSSDSNPRKEIVVRPNLDVNITWMLCNLSSPGASVIIPSFAIDRNVEACRTPSNNPNVLAASNFFLALHGWVKSVHNYFSSQIFAFASKDALDLSAINANGIFIPVLPIFHKAAESEGEIAASRLQLGDSAPPSANGSSSLELTASDDHLSSVLFNLTDIDAFLAEEQRNFQQKYAVLSTTFQSDTHVISASEARLLVALLHVSNVIQFYNSGVHAIEEMLRVQLVAAIGKVVTPNDFTMYMRFHNSKLFADAYRPKPFCYAVRRSATHSPEGVLSIEEKLSDGSMPEPIYTMCSGPSDGSVQPMTFSLNAAVNVTFHGQRYVHAWLSQRFQYSAFDSNESSLLLKAGARQFSGYIVLLGRISSATSFDPKFGMIVQNKDEFNIPLELERIPSAKEFKEAIQSISPEQQAFAKAFRGMQLESTLFGICVIQIKPQLEKLLRLCPDSLTKEIQLTQDLMELFITYQIPSDLLSFSGSDDAHSADRIAEVKGYTSAMLKMIEDSKKRELNEKKQEDLYASNLAYHSSGSSASGEDEDNVSLYGVVEKDICDFASVELCEASIAPKKSKGIGHKIGKLLGRVTNTLRSEAEEESNARDDSTDWMPPRKKIVNKKSETSSSKELSLSGVVQTDVIEVMDKKAEGGVDDGVEANQSSQRIDDLEDVAAAVEAFDYTQIPKVLEQTFTDIDKEGAVRPTIINPGSTWTKRAQKALLAEPSTSTYGADDQKQEKNRAFDLLDALSRSGGLSVDHASLHIVIAATHCFDLSVMDTIVKNNVNPIEKVERSSIVIATTIHQRPAEDLLLPEHQQRLSQINKI